MLFDQLILLFHCSIAVFGTIMALHSSILSTKFTSRYYTSPFATHGEYISRGSWWRWEKIFDLHSVPLHQSRTIASNHAILLHPPFRWNRAISGLLVLWEAPTFIYSPHPSPGCLPQAKIGRHRPWAWSGGWRICCGSALVSIWPLGKVKLFRRRWEWNQMTKEIIIFGSIFGLTSYNDSHDLALSGAFQAASSRPHYQTKEYWRLRRWQSMQRNVLTFATSNDSWVISFSLSEATPKRPLPRNFR